MVKPLQLNFLPSTSNEYEEKKREEKETKRNTNRFLKSGSVVGLIFSVACLVILCIMFFSYEMYLVNSVAPRYLKETDDACKATYEDITPLVRMNLTSSKDLYGVFSSVDDYSNIFTNELGCECDGTERNTVTANLDKLKNWTSLQSPLLEPSDMHRLRSCDYLCRFKNGKHDDLKGDALEAFKPSNIKSLFVGLREEDLDISEGFEDYFFDEVCMERFEEWVDYKGRRCDSCAEEFYQRKDKREKGILGGKVCYTATRQDINTTVRLEPRQYKTCSRCTKDRDRPKDDVCYSHALCNYLTHSEASIMVSRGDAVYCVKAGCTDENNLGRQFERTREFYTIALVTFCFGVIYNICLTVFFIIRIINGYKLCGREEFEKMKKRKRLSTAEQDAIDADAQEYSSYASACCGLFVYAHAVQGIVYIVLISILQFGFITPLTSSQQKVQEADYISMITYYGNMNPLYTAKVGFMYDLNGWHTCLWIFSLLVYIIDASSGIALFCYKDNKANFYEAFMKKLGNANFFNFRGSVKKTIERRSKGVERKALLKLYKELENARDDKYRQEEIYRSLKAALRGEAPRNAFDPYNSRNTMSRQSQNSTDISVNDVEIPDQRLKDAAKQVIEQNRIKGKEDNPPSKPNEDNPPSEPEEDNEEDDLLGSLGPGTEVNMRFRSIRF